ncbi:MAG: MarR family transcriptional regulator [Candidatus Lokiarchaeota archaeon]|nr:MarR family transcriptional regulator [Candidatus Lokiarchaeota archaeon]
MSESEIQSFIDIPESYQEYIETIFRLSVKRDLGKIKQITNIAIANYMDIKSSSVTNMLRKLSKKNLIRWKPRSKDIKLTPLGAKIGRKIVFNHVIMAIFLKNTLGIDDNEIIHKLACELEHHMKDPIMNAFKRIMGKKAIKDIEKKIDEGLDPEELDKVNIQVLPTPERILNEFGKEFINSYPDYKSAFLKEKENFLERY